MFLTNTLSWTEHIKTISNKTNGVLWKLKYYRNSLSTPLRIRLVTSLIFPFFDYCVALLTDLTGQQKLKLKRLINACVRFIFNLRKDEHVSHFYDALGWLFADDRRAYLTCCFLFSIIRSGTPHYLASNFRPQTNPRLHSHSSPLDLVILLCRTTTYQRSFHCFSSTMWNSLPISIRESPTQHEFRGALFSHLRQPMPGQTRRPV